MLRFQGWIVVLPHWLEEQEGGVDLHAAGTKIRLEAERLNRYGNVFIAVKNLNGEDTISIAGAANRKREEDCEILKFIRLISSLAPGSYGVVHFMDDEKIDKKVNDVYQCYVLKKGNLTLEVEDRFSPFSLEVAE